MYTMLLSSRKERMPETRDYHHILLPFLGPSIRHTVCYEVITCMYQSGRDSDSECVAAVLVE